MCELTFSDLGELNKTYFVHQSIINALANNNDGIGYMQDGEVWKSKLSGAHITNLGTMARDMLTDKPLAFHTRYATNKTLNEDCHSHPFDGEKLILMHNGKLEKKDNTIIEAGKVDSQVFATELELEIAKTPDIPIVDLMQKVMDDWCGKFAFMIYDIRDKNYYVIRGTTADLHWTTVNGKLVVNTQKIDLRKGIHALCQQNQLMTGKALDVEKIEELKVNSIYKFQPKDSVLELVGELKENRPALVASAAWTNDARYAAYYPQTNVRPINQQIPPHERFKKWLDFHGMTLHELNNVSNVIMGCSILELDADDLQCFYVSVLTKLDSVTLPESLLHWKAIVKEGYADWAYLKPEFSFPWMLNTGLELAKMLGEVDEEIIRRKKEKEDKKVTT